MNTFSNLGGVLTPLVVAYAVEQWQSWTIPFYVTAVVYAAGALFWLAIDPARPIVEPEPFVRLKADATYVEAFDIRPR
jgi:sugar phosphate permease